ncbi:MAG: YiiX/YebB-like N1pC/P60 family cysteine hydrolase [Cyclobacteriaceae bacterium]
MKPVFFALVIVSMALLSCFPKPDFKWQEGDILFQDGDCGEFCEAIRKVTQGYRGRDFTHNGLLMQENGAWYVIEAISIGVTKTPLDDFLYRHKDDQGQPQVVVGRLKPEFQHLIPDAILEAKSLLGKPYDFGFDFENEAYYCSELIHFAFKKANENDNLFEPAPMTFHDPETGELFHIWKDYFDKHELSVPEGKPGLNPGGMSQAPVLEIVHDYID